MAIASLAAACAMAWETAANIEQAAASVTFGAVTGAKRGSWEQGRLDIGQYKAS
jgi:hypothetical protein